MPLNSIAAGEFWDETNKKIKISHYSMVEPNTLWDETNKKIKISHNSTVEPNTLFETDPTLDQSQTMYLKQNAVVWIFDTSLKPV